VLLVWSEGVGVMVTLYAWAFTVGLFAVPAVLVARFAVALDRPGITDRRITSTVWRFAGLALGFVALWAFILPAPGDL